MDRNNTSSNDSLGSADAIQELGALWNIHVYGFAAYFIALSVLIVPSCITSCQNCSQTSNRLPGSLHVMLAIFCLPRALILFVDPYYSRAVLHKMAYSLFGALSVPALTSASCIVLLAILDSTRLSLCPPKFQNLPVIILISVLHYSVYVTTVLIIYFVRNVSYMVRICHTLTSTWGFTVAIGYIIAAYRIRRNIQFTLPTGGPKDTEDDTTRKILRLTLVLFLCAGLSGVEFGAAFYGAFGAMSSRVTSTSAVKAPYSWWIFQTLLRLLEACLSVSVLFLASRSSQKGMFPSPWDSLWKRMSSRISPE